MLNNSRNNSNSTLLLGLRGNNNSLRRSTTKITECEKEEENGVIECPN
jgi:hypothetical protein